LSTAAGGACDEDDSGRTLAVIARRYAREVYPTKAVRTRKDNYKELAQLLRVFGHMPINSILPMHMREYWTCAGSLPRCERTGEKALFSHIFNKAREWGYTAAQNPCQGVKGFREAERDRYVTDDEFARVKAHAHHTVADAMDLALLTGQRPADVLKLRRADIREGALWIVQNKTGARLGIGVTGELSSLLDRINARPKNATAHFSFKTIKGSHFRNSRCAHDLIRRAGLPASASSSAI
jgi:integrase